MFSSVPCSSVLMHAQWLSHDDSRDVMEKGQCGKMFLAKEGKIHLFLEQGACMVPGWMEGGCGMGNVLKQRQLVKLQFIGGVHGSAPTAASLCYRRVE